MTFRNTDTEPDILALVNEVRNCSVLTEALKTLARTVGTLCRAERAGVFLLDESKRRLLLYSSWSVGEGSREEPCQSLSLDRHEDPLCYCLITGKRYEADLASSDSTRLLGGVSRYCMAFPLLAGGNVSMGGVLVSADRIPSPSALRGGELLCACGALLLDALLQKQHDFRLLKSLRDDLRSVEEQRRNADSPVLGRILGQSEGIRHVRDLVLKIAATDASVLITGETGTGKELVADAIHALSTRSSAPFLKVNCAALPAQLLESELFGYKKGAFSGATGNSKGLLRSADGGTLLLDEIGDMPAELQAKLLRFLQDHQVRPLGDVRHYPVSIRIVAATNANLREALEQGGFRRDLYHRLAAFQIHIPPLRERQEDILPLAMHFLKIFTARYGRKILSFPPETLMALTSYDFPGNVRELVNHIESAVLSWDERDLGSSVAPVMNGGGDRRSWNLDLKTHLFNMEQAIISHTLAHFEGNASKAAGALGLPRSTLMSKLRKGFVSEPLVRAQPERRRKAGGLRDGRG